MDFRGFVRAGPFSACEQYPHISAGTGRYFIPEKGYFFRYFQDIWILSRISAVLAEHQIGIFAVSTYNTDYVFTKRDAFPRAISLLKERGYRIVPENPHF